MKNHLKDFEEEVGKAADKFLDLYKEELHLKYPLDLSIYNQARLLSLEEFREWLWKEMKLAETRI